MDGKLLYPALAAAVSGATAPAEAVRLDADGLGQALVYPYYTVQSSGGAPFNTLVSVVNHRAEPKAVRVRVLEGRAGVEVLNFNVFLAPNDVWTAAIVPSSADPSAPARIVSADASCTAPALPAQGVDFRNVFFATSGDRAGTELDRTREGFIEMIEMATLTGATGAAVTPRNAPPNCAPVQQFGSAPFGTVPPEDLAPPTGGLSGGFTLVNVANGLAFDQPATALAELSTRAMYRTPGGTLDFNATEIAPASTVVANGAVYRSTWLRPVDAVSATLMRSHAFGEYVLDTATRSNTDVVLTFPTRSHYVSTSAVVAPFSGNAGWAPGCFTGESSVGTPVNQVTFDRESLARPPSGRVTAPPPVSGDVVCAASVVFGVANGQAHTTAQAATNVLGSLTRGLSEASVAAALPTTQDGWIDVSLASPNPSLVSQPASMRIDTATGATTSGPHRFDGLPVVGFTARTFANGTLPCGAGHCLGSYGGALSLSYARSVSP